VRAFEQVPTSDHKPVKTLLEVAGVSERERVWSNILAFLLDPNEKHQMGDVVLKALVELHSRGKAYSSGAFGAVKVETEVNTKNGKLLDLVIQTDPLVVGIENKINASDYNDFRDYSDHIDELAEADHKDDKAARTARDAIKILLNLRGIEPSPEHWDFESVTYNDFFKNLRQHLGPKILEADQRYLGYLIDFMTTVQNVMKGTHMNPQLLKFFQENSTLAHRFYLSTVELLDDMKAKIRPLKDMDWPKTTEVKFEDCSGGESVSEFAWWSWCVIDLGNGVELGLQAGLMPNRWEIASTAIP
jgi:hypothetical protein